MIEFDVILQLIDKKGKKEKAQTSNEATIEAAITANTSPGLNEGLPHWNG